MQTPTANCRGPQEFPATAENLARVRAALRAAFHEAQKRDPILSMQKLSRVLGRSLRYWPRAVRGEGKLHLEEVCKVLVALDFEPGTFFLTVFPEGGEAEQRLRTAREPRAEFGLPLEELVEPLRRQVRRQTPREWLERSRAALRSAIRDSPYTQGQLSVRLEFRSARALSMALWGSTSLTLRHVFLVLEALGKPPSRFFFEVFDPQRGPLIEDLALPDLLDPLDRVYALAVEALQTEFSADAAPAEEIMRPEGTDRDSGSDEGGG